MDRFEQEQADKTMLSRYSFPDTSDRRDDECFPDFWDRKRRERHGPGCQCQLCANEDRLPADHSWCAHTYVEDPDVVQG